MTKTEAFAPAKINLTLHVTGQREDGYHLLDSLVVFPDIGDTVQAQAAPSLSLSVSGPMANGVPTDGRNLVMKAAALLPGNRGAQITLIKRLPTASGIGGGSSDAASALRALAQLWQAATPDPAAVLSLGADVPVCMDAAPARMQGIGEDLSRPPTIPECYIALVNPGVEVSTPAVFKALASRNNPAMPAQLPNWSDAAELASWLHTQRNDLQPAAEIVAPVVADVIHALNNTAPLITRMSGSGATCFALYSTLAAANAGAQAISAAHPDWWVAAGSLQHDRTAAKA